MSTPTVTPAPPSPEAPLAEPGAPEAEKGAERKLARLLRWRPTSQQWKSAARIVGAYLAALVIFGAFVSLRHINPFSMYRAIWTSTITNRYGFGQVLVKTAPFILAGLAVAIPARAG